jgi:hypothetical protein
LILSEAEIREKRAGSFHRTGARKRDKARWKPAKFKGWILNGSDLTAKVNSDDWQLLAAFVGWVERHFGEQVQALNIQYQ